MYRIIGITGTLGAGKGTVTEYLVSRGFRHFAVSDTFLKNEAIRRGLAPDRQARTDIANEYRARGPDKLMEALYEMAEPAITAGDSVIIEPQHTRAEVEFIKRQGGIVFGVDAELEIRYERIRSRAGPKDGISFEEFAAIQKIQLASTDPNKNNLAAALAAADLQLLNNGSLEELHAQIETALARMEA